MPKPPYTASNSKCANDEGEILGLSQRDQSPSLPPSKKGRSKLFSDPMDEIDPEGSPSEQNANPNSNDWEIKESMPWIDMMHATEERALEMWNQPRRRLRGLHKATDHPTQPANPCPHTVSPQRQQTVPKKEELDQKQPTHQLKQPIIPLTLANLAVVPVSSTLEWLGRPMRFGSKYLGCSMSFTASSRSPLVTSSILGDCDSHYVSADPVVRWLDRLNNKYFQLAPINHKRILSHPFNRNQYMRLELSDLLAWGEALSEHSPGVTLECPPLNTPAFDPSRWAALEF